jgi:hypothetical protein
MFWRVTCSRVAGSASPAAICLRLAIKKALDRPGNAM